MPLIFLRRGIITECMATKSRCSQTIFTFVIYIMDIALINTSFGISDILTLDTVYEMVYGMMKSTLAREAVKNSFLEHAYKEEVRF